MADDGTAEEISEELLDRIEAGEEHPPKPDFLNEEEWQNVIAGRNPMIIRMAGTGHADAYRATAGEGLDETQGAPVIVLTTVGRKTGNDVATCVNYMVDGDDLIVVGSFAGFRDSPHWVLNLEQTPTATVEMRDRTWAVAARLITGDERRELWPQLIDYFPLWGHFQKYCRREFKVFVLSPA